MDADRVRDDLFMLAELEQIIGHQFRHSDLLRIAFTHRSYHFENKDSSPGHFERLEFLGDAVLDLLLSELLMQQYPDVDEGTLSKWRASLVNEQSLSDVAKNLNFGKFMFLGRSETQNREQAASRPRLLASVFEAVVAALYQDAGLERVREFILREFQPLIARLDKNNEYAQDFKTRLQEMAQKKWKTLPEYRMIGTTGPEHAKTFRFEVWIGDQSLGSGEGNSRKAAEQDAARAALSKLGDQI